MATHRESSGIDPGNKSAAEIEQEVRRSRADLEETLDAIQERLSPGQLLDQAFGYFRGGGGEFVRNLGGTISHNPVPVTLLGIGLAWMMMSDQRSRRAGGRGESYDWGEDELDYDEPFEPYGYDEPYGTVGAEAGYGPAGYGPASYDADEVVGSRDTSGPGVGERARERAAGLGEQASEFGGRARERAAGLSEQASEFGGRARERASGLADRAKHAASGVGHTARDFGGRAGGRLAGARAGLANRAERSRLRASRYGRRAREGAYQAFTDHPLVLGALGLAVGAALGAMVPPTRTEDEYLGETGDKLQRRAGESAREGVARARSAAESAYAAAQDEAERQGLTPEAAREASRAAADKAGHAAAEKATEVADKTGKVAEAARSAAERDLKSGTGEGKPTGNKPSSA